MKSLLVVLVFGILSATITAAQETKETDIAVYTDPPLEKWLLSNGSEVEARLLYFSTRTNEDKDNSWDVILMATNTNKIVELRYSNFDKSIHPTLKKRQAKQRLPRQQRAGERPYPEAPPLGWQYAKYEGVIRDFIPTYNQTDYGYKAGSCVPNSLVNSLAWWDQQKIVKFPQKRNREKQVDWLHTRITRESKTRNRGTTFQDLIDGVAEFTRDDLNGDYRFPCFRVDNLTPEKLAFYTKGNAAVCLHVDVYSRRKHLSGHGVTVKKATADGKLTINTWGYELDGILVPRPAKFQSKEKDAPIKYEIKWRNTIDLPEYITNMQIRFTLASGSCYVFLPLEKQKAGMTWRPAPQSYYRDGTTPQERSKSKKKKLVRKKFQDPTRIAGQKVFFTKPKVNSKGKPLHLIGGGVSLDSYGSMQSVSYAVAKHGATVKFYSIMDFPKEHRSTVKNVYRFYYSATRNGRKMFNWSDLPDMGQRDKVNKHFKLFSEDFQKGASIENSFANALIWWESIGLIDLSKYNFTDRDSICEAVATKSKSNLASKNWKAMARKVDTLAKTQFNDDYQFYYREKELTFKNLHQECKHNQAVMLGVSLVVDQGYFSHGINIISATPKGEIVFQAWGERYEGKIISKRVNGYYPIKITSGAIPEWFTEKKVKLVISRSGKAIKIFRPLIKVKEGIIYRRPFADILNKK